VKKCTDSDGVHFIESLVNDERVLTGFGVLGVADDYNMLYIAKMSLRVSLHTGADSFLMR